MAKTVLFLCRRRIFLQHKIICLSLQRSDNKHMTERTLIKHIKHRGFSSICPHAKFSRLKSITDTCEMLSLLPWRWNQTARGWEEIGLVVFLYGAKQKDGQWIESCCYRGELTEGVSVLRRSTLSRSDLRCPAKNKAISWCLRLLSNSSRRTTLRVRVRVCRMNDVQANQKYFPTSSWKHKQTLWAWDTFSSVVTFYKGCCILKSCRKCRRHYFYAEKTLNNQDFWSVTEL